MTQELEKLNRLIETLQNTADEVDTVLLDEALLTAKYTCEVSELRESLDKIREGISQLSEQLSELTEEK